MAYHFKKTESVSRGVRRLACERIEDALACLDRCDRIPEIHGARKDIKKVRAVLRLARPHMAKRDFRALNRRLRKAAAELATSRDACVKAQVAGTLARRVRPLPARRALHLLRDELRQACKDEMKRCKRRTARTAARKLRAVARVLARLKVDGGGWSVLRDGMDTAYRRGQRACRIALADPSPGNLHAWRKRAKDLWYQMATLRPAWREDMEAYARTLDVLCDRLGEYHDLAMLREESKRRLGDRTASLKTLRGPVARRQRKLLQEALALGARLYAGRPGAFVDWIGASWKTWRHTAKSRDRG